MNENMITGKVIDTCIKIHQTLGPGLFESVYETILQHELEKENFMVERQKAIPVYWGNLQMEVGFRADLIIDNKVILEIKSVETLAPVHSKQLLTYLKITGIQVGLLINFNVPLLKQGIHRIVNQL